MHYLRQGGWDFFGQVFTESHCIGHQCWHLHDAGHPAFDPAVTAVTGDPMREVYRAIDQGIGEILACVGPDTTVIVLLGHRMAHKFGAQFLLRRILAKLGVAVLQRAAGNRRHAHGRRLTRAWQSLPPGLQRLLGGPRALARVVARRAPPAGPGSCRPRSRRSMPRGARCSSWTTASRRAACGSISRAASPRVSSPRRTPTRSARGSRADPGQLTYADTGERVVSRVRRTRDLYQGEHLDLLPDLLVEWDDQPLSRQRDLRQSARQRGLASARRRRASSPASTATAAPAITAARACSWRSVRASAGAGSTARFHHGFRTDVLRAARRAAAGRGWSGDSGTARVESGLKPLPQIVAAASVGAALAAIPGIHSGTSHSACHSPHRCRGQRLPQPGHQRLQLLVQPERQIDDQKPRAAQADEVRRLDLQGHAGRCGGCRSPRPSPGIALRRDRGSADTRSGTCRPASDGGSSRAIRPRG